LLDLLSPEIDTGFWQRRSLAIAVPVPKTAIYKNNGLPFRKNQIRPAGKLCAVKTKAEAKPMSCFPNGDFWSGVLRTHRAHNQ
jgi:hypothetical protein